tara:strand:+ start:7578 stop:8024 length:447 start_codon:yes stop_codon:yes gene_type:complete
MKRLLLLTLLILYGCSKDSMESDLTGNQIIGNYQILQSIPKQDEYCFWGNFYSANTKGHDLFSYWEDINSRNVRGTLNFSPDLKGYYDIKVENENIRVDFNWSFNGTKWNLTDINSNFWEISYCNSIYIMRRRSDGGKMSQFNYRLIF